MLHLIFPPLGYLPADYFTSGAGTAEGQMGKHWLPVNLGDYLPFSKNYDLWFL
jgi:hypothetical protein